MVAARISGVGTSPASLAAFSCRNSSRWALLPVGCAVGGVTLVECSARPGSKHVRADRQLSGVGEVSRRQY